MFDVDAVRIFGIPTIYCSILNTTDNAVAHSCVEKFARVHLFVIKSYLTAEEARRGRKEFNALKTTSLFPNVLLSLVCLFLVCLLLQCNLRYLFLCLNWTELCSNCFEILKLFFSCCCCCCFNAQLTDSSALCLQSLLSGQKIYFIIIRESETAVILKLCTNRTQVCNIFSGCYRNLQVLLLYYIQELEVNTHYAV